MDLEKAIEAVDLEKNSGRTQKTFFTWAEWTEAEKVLREAGDEERAHFAHVEKMRAYHKEERNVDLL